MAKATPTGLSAETLKRDLRRVVLAGVGAAVLAKEGAVDLAKKFLAKGEDVEPELRKALKRLSDRRREAAARADGLRTKVDGRLRRFVEALPLATRRDLAQLSGRIDTLSAKVDSLSRKRK